MEWTKIGITTTSAGTEPLTGLLLSCGISGVEIIDPEEYSVFLEQDKSSWDYVDEKMLGNFCSNRTEVIFYLSADEEGGAALDRIKKRLANFSLPYIDMGSLAVKEERVDDTIWLNEWKKHFAPIYIGRVAIIPEWEKAPDLPKGIETVFILDPGSAFGTGQHATTYLCVEVLQERLKPGDIMLDAGCGSGILSVIGLLLGAERVVACDIDPSAVSATRKNAALNPVDASRLMILHGNIITDENMRSDIGKRTYDIIAANIVADVVIALLPFIPALLSKGGFFIASGIIDDRAGDVIAALAGSGLAMVSNKEMDGWFCLVCTHA